LYQTEVINALLAEVQGMDPEDPVIVVGATNDAERVDPALRRAGRLDQVVAVPLPNVEGLEKIFEHHLRTYRDAEQVESNVDLHTVAELCLGLTGADVEFFVRGAFRRARHAQRTKISQEDLLAEVTRRPRRPDSAPVLLPDARHRVAVHEAGHAVATLTSSSGGRDLTFVTIVPRLDGSLGFVASVPKDEHVLTRQALIERIEIALAGRAAEELEYGRDEVGTGAGGPSPTSDLAAATQMATMLVCQAGLGSDGSLLWTAQADEAQLEQVRKVLDAAYRDVCTRISEHKALHERIVAVLEEKQELSGNELRGYLAATS
jgi:ATP-dependent Zn protease